MVAKSSDQSFFSSRFHSGRWSPEPASPSSALCRVRPWERDGAPAAEKRAMPAPPRRRACSKPANRCGAATASHPNPPPRRLRARLPAGVLLARMPAQQRRGSSDVPLKTRLELVRLAADALRTRGRRDSAQRGESPLRSIAAPSSAARQVLAAPDRRGESRRRRVVVEERANGAESDKSICSPRCAQQQRRGAPKTGRRIAGVLIDVPRRSAAAARLVTNGSGTAPAAPREKAFDWRAVVVLPGAVARAIRRSSAATMLA